MLVYILRRLLQSILAIFIVLTLVFIIVNLLGDPVRIVLPPNANPEQIAAVRERLGLDNPVWQRYWEFVSGAIRGDFGDSYWQQRPALELAVERIPATLSLAFVAMVIIVPVGVGLGVVSALKPRSILETFASFFSFISVSLVDFWLALMLILVFAVTLGWLPTSGYGTPAHFILPAVTIAVLSFGTLAQLTRASVTEELGKAYVFAARFRGIPERTVVIRHVLRNALIPVVTVCGSILISIAGGSVIAEVVFGWPGLGLLFIQAIERRDLPLLQATVFLTAVMVAIINLAVDLMYRWINPKVKWA